MQAIQEIEQQYTKKKVAQVQSGDTVRVHHRIKEGAKSRVQVFEGVVIRTHRLNSLSAVITVRRIASGVGVEKTYLLHSPNVEKVEVLRRSKVRRNFLSYLRARRGKSARLQEVDFDKKKANDVFVPTDETPEAPDEEVVEGESVVAEVSTEEVAAEENKEAGKQEAPKQADDPADEGDEAAAPAEEVQDGLDKAE